MVREPVAGRGGLLGAGIISTRNVGAAIVSRLPNPLAEYLNAECATIIWL